MSHPTCTAPHTCSDPHSGIVVSPLLRLTGRMPPPPLPAPPQGSSSPITQPWQPDLTRYPLYAATPAPLRAVLEPGREGVGGRGILLHHRHRARMQAGRLWYAGRGCFSVACALGSSQLPARVP